MGMRSKKTRKLSHVDSHIVKHNDIVILGTDGVHDNLFDEQIIKECIRPNLRANGELPRVEDAALCISALAESTSYSNTIETPWTKAAVAAGKKREKEIGGK